MATYAKVAIESPLPQLDRLFDYIVPDALAGQIFAGQRVKVAFGKSAKQVTGFVVELVDSIEYSGTVNPIAEIVSAHIVLPSNTYELIRAVADRQAVTFGDVAKAAIPNFMVRAAKTLPQAIHSTNIPVESPYLVARVCQPVMKVAEFGEIQVFENSWILDFIDLTLDEVSEGRSVILCVPDYRDVGRLVAVFASLGLESLTTVFGSDQTNSVRYVNHIKVSGPSPNIVIGTRSSLFAPVHNLGSILIWDDEDASHQDQSSPYVSSRDVALIRQTIDNCSLAFLAHSRSASIQRLVNLEYLKDTTNDFVKPRVAHSEKDVRVDTLAFKTLRAGLQHGPVLVQVSNLGIAKSAYCRGCATRANCLHCHGPLWVDNHGKNRCRWCNGFNLSFKCSECGGTELRMGRAGSTRTAAELGKAFPGVPIVEATGENIVSHVDGAPKIVIATPGAEPVADAGFFAVVILDCDVALGRDTLKAREDAVRSWANAVALCNAKASSALIGLKSDLGGFLSTWRMVDYAKLELAQREALGFPPVTRMLSAVGLRAPVTKLSEQLGEVEGCRVLGLAPTENPEEWQAIISFNYSVGKQVADMTRTFQLKNSGLKRVNAKSGQNQRAVSIKIDDPRVL